MHPSSQPLSSPEILEITRRGYTETDSPGYKALHAQFSAGGSRYPLEVMIVKVVVVGVIMGVKILGNSTEVLVLMPSACQSLVSDQ